MLPVACSTRLYHTRANATASKTRALTACFQVTKGCANEPLDVHLPMRLFGGRNSRNSSRTQISFRMNGASQAGLLEPCCCCSVVHIPVASPMGNRNVHVPHAQHLICTATQACTKAQMVSSYKLHKRAGRMSLIRQQPTGCVNSSSTNLRGSRALRCW